MQKRHTLISIIVATALVACSATQTELNPEEKEVLVSSDRISNVEINDALNTNSSLIRSVPLYFDTDAYAVKDSHSDTLRQIKLALSHDPDLKIYIQGHADELGDQKYNIALSKKRAESILGHLELSKETYKRVGVDFFGEDKPRCKSQDAEGLSCNRRVDIFLVK